MKFYHDHFGGDTGVTVQQQTWLFPHYYEGWATKFNANPLGFDIFIRSNPDRQCY